MTTSILGSTASSSVVSPDSAVSATAAEPASATASAGPRCQNSFVWLTDISRPSPYLSRWTTGGPVGSRDGLIGANAC